MIFLIEYDRPEGRIVTLRPFEESQRSQAENSRLATELELHRKGLDHEVVLLEADNEDALRRTHRRYFEKVSEIGRSGFVIMDVDWEYKSPRVFTGSRESRPPIRVGVNRLALRCNRCGTEWSATRSRSGAPGSFLTTIGHVIPTCPHCGQSVPIATSQLELSQASETPSR
jgi:hypothetical protein